MFLLIRADTNGSAKKQTEQGGDSKKKAQGFKNEPMNVEIIEAPKKSAQKSALEASKDGELPATMVDKNCLEYFGGIGIEEFYTWDKSGSLRTQVGKVYPGYPAEKAGIQVGDELLNSEEIRGDIGTRITVRTRRDGSELNYEITREKICTRKKGE